jgi:hypothetical protein
MPGLVIAAAGGLFSGGLLLANVRQTRPTSGGTPSDADQLRRLAREEDSATAGEGAGGSHQATRCALTYLRRRPSLSVSAL